MINTKSLIATIAIFISFNINAASIDINTMTIASTSYDASGELFSFDNGSSGQPYGAASGILFFQQWDAWAVEFFDDTSGLTLHYDGIDGTTGDLFDYEFTLSEGQLAWGMGISFASGNDHPVLAIIDCGSGSPGDICTGIGTPMQGGPFSGSEFSLSGEVSPVPLPAAAWLFTTGFISLIGAFHITSSSSGRKKHAA